MLYIPCLATIAVLAKEFGARTAAVISLVEVFLAVALAGVIFRVLVLLGFG
jgi:ferrous iron transport protein B